MWHRVFLPGGAVAFCQQLVVGLAPQLQGYDIVVAAVAGEDRRLAIGLQVVGGEQIGGGKVGGGR